MTQFTCYLIETCLYWNVSGLLENNSIPCKVLTHVSHKYISNDSMKRLQQVNLMKGFYLASADPDLVFHIEKLYFLPLVTLMLYL
jgi:hypothetical protein